MISFVGAGPGAVDLITLRGAERLSQADVVVWASSLVPEALLTHARPGAVVYDSSGMTLEDVLDVYAQNPQAAIVRLHSGDPALYGAIQEQITWCLVHERDFEIVPGVSSVAAAAAALGIELTVPGLGQSVVLTRIAGRTAASVPDNESLARFAAHGTTMAVFLSAARPKQLQGELLAAGSGYSAATPAAIVVRATWPDQLVVRTTVGQLAQDLATTGARTTVLVLVGPALGASQPQTGLDACDPPERQDQDVPSRSHLYSPGYAHQFRYRSLPGSTAGRPARAGPRSDGSDPRQVQ